MQVMQLLLDHGAKLDAAAGALDPTKPIPGYMDVPSAYSIYYFGHLNLPVCLHCYYKKPGAMWQADGWTPLHVACWKGHAAAAKLLLQHGALVNATGSICGDGPDIC